MRLFIALAMSMFVGSAFAVPNTDDDLGSSSDFWKDWNLTVQLVSCKQASDRHVCEYQIMNQHGLEVGFSSDSAGSEVTSFLVTTQGVVDDLIFLITAATAIKAVAPELSPESRETLVKELFRTAMSDGSAEKSESGWSVKINRVVFGSAWVAEGRVTD